MALWSAIEARSLVARPPFSQVSVHGKVFHLVFRKIRCLDRFSIRQIFDTKGHRQIEHLLCVFTCYLLGVYLICYVCYVCLVQCADNAKV